MCFAKLTVYRNNIMGVAIILFLIILENISLAANTRRNLFFISKSENKNQVHYAINLDSKCLPEGKAPVYPYWQMLEKGPSFTEGLLPREQGAYGIRSQKVNENIVSVILNALPKKTITVLSSLDNNVCHVGATTLINGELAKIKSVHVDLWTFGVSKITVIGSRKDGTEIKEIIK